MIDQPQQPEIIARSEDQARNWHLRVLPTQILEWDHLVPQLLDGESLIALVRHGKQATFFLLEHAAHFAHIENVYIRSGSATSVTLYGCFIFGGRPS